MRSIVIHVAPLLIGAVVGIGFGTGVTRHGDWPDIRYRILEMDPVARNIALIGLLSLGAGLGGLLAALLKSAGDGDFEFSPAPDKNYAWQNLTVTGSLVLTGLFSLAAGIYVFN